MQGAVAQDGVGAQSNVHVELNVVARGHFGDVIKNLNSSLGAAELFGIGINHRCGGAHRSRGVELIGAKDDIDWFCDTLLP